MTIAVAHDAARAVPARRSGSRGCRGPSRSAAVHDVGLGHGAVARHLLVHSAGSPKYVAKRQRWSARSPAHCMDTDELCLGLGRTRSSSPAVGPLVSKLVEHLRDPCSSASARNPGRAVASTTSRSLPFVRSKVNAVASAAIAARARGADAAGCRFRCRGSRRTTLAA